jgi:XTP/dITP diphosphohydrolase
MSHPLVFATNNAHKVQEIRRQLGGDFEIMTMREAGIEADIPEPHDTLEANASEKSGFVWRQTGLNCFSEDTGLEVEALGGAPGVRSARFAGEQASYADNVALLLQRMEGISNRKARFRTVISLRWDGEELFFEGVCNGTITKEAQGTSGFGYDPVFVPENDKRTFAEMPLEAKIGYSHRAKAVHALLRFLKGYGK